MRVVALTKYECEEVGDGEAKQVEVSSGVQVRVCCYDDAGTHVAKQPGDEDDAVDDGESERSGKVATARAKMRLQERVEIEFG